MIPSHFDYVIIIELHKQKCGLCPHDCQGWDETCLSKFGRESTLALATRRSYPVRICVHMTAKLYRAGGTWIGPELRNSYVKVLERDLILLF
jgi:hypothetical protein